MTKYITKLLKTIAPLALGTFLMMGQATSTLANMPSINISKSNQATEQKTEKQKYKYQPTSIEISMPEHLTQQSPDFYKNPNEEFGFYKEKYIEFATDGKIDSMEIEALEKILSETLKEIDKKTLNQHEQLKDNFPKTEESYVYLNFARKMKYVDLDSLQEHLSIREEWLESNIVNTCFWHYGIGPNGKGNTEKDASRHPYNYIEPLPIIFKKSFYKIPTSPNLEDRTSIPHVLRLDEEFPAETKIPKWLGFLFGLGFPLALTYGTSKLKEKNPRDNYFFLQLYNVASSAYGLTGDAIHPAAFPIRTLAIPIVINTLWYLLSRKTDYSNTPWNSSSNEHYEFTPEEKKDTNTLGFTKQR